MIKPLRFLFLTGCVVFILGFVHATAFTEEQKPLGNLTYQVLDNTLLQTAPTLRWYDPKILTEGVYIFHQNGHRALLVVKPSPEKQQWAVKKVVATTHTVEVDLALVPKTTGESLVTPLLLELPQLNLQDQRPLAVIFDRPGLNQ